MQRKAIRIPPAGTVTPARRRIFPFAWLNIFGQPDPVDELAEQGWRLVGVDENGQKLYAPPARHSRWSSWP
jgi:hypothetical protein